MLISKFLSYIKDKTTPKVITRETDGLLQFLLCVNDEPRARIKCIIYADKGILIGDIVHERKEYNRGYGSQMMEELISYARANGYKYIYGNLSEVDRDHADRLHHFYQKFGFAITIFDKPKDLYYGKIEKWLDGERLYGQQTETI